MRSAEEIQQTIDSWWDGEKPREGPVQDRERIQDRPRDRPRDTIQDTPRDRVRDSIQDRPRHEVQDKLRDRDPRDKTILQDPPRFDRENLQDSMIRRTRPPSKHPLDDAWRRTRVPVPKKYEPVTDLPLDDPLPVDGLVEVVPGVFMTPDDPVDPRDCDLYPDSPWCGGFPWSTTPMGFDPKIVVDECAIGLRVTPIIGYTNMPPIEIQYRRPGKCREKEEPDIPEKPVPPPINWPPGNLEDPCVILFSRKHTFIATRFIDGKLIFREELTEIESTSQYQPCAPGKDSFGFDTIIPLKYLYSKKSTVIGKELYAGKWERWNTTGFEQYPAQIGIQERYGDIVAVMEESLKNPLLNGLEILFDGEDALGRRETIIYLRKTQINVDAFYQPVCVEQPIPPPPYPPQKLPDCRCMRCCGDSKDNNNLDDIKAMLNKIQKSIGSDNFPAKAPAWLNDFGQGDITINSMSEYVAYIVKQMDAVLGNFPIKIKIKDSDLTKEGNQEITLNIPNMAEGIAELLGLALTTRTETDAILNAVIRNLVETGSTRQQVFLAYQLAMANAEFLGYELKQKQIKVPFAFTPGKSKLDEILKESEQTIVGYENTDSQDIKDLVAPLLELAAMWKAQNFKRVHPISTAADILSILKDGKRMYDQYNARKDGGSEFDEDKWDSSWDEFQRQVEQGWIETPGISDDLNPYGRNYSERPRIRELGDTSDGETNAN